MLLLNVVIVNLDDLGRGRSVNRDEGGRVPAIFIIIENYVWITRLR
jgi:hypothetical protein